MRKVATIPDPNSPFRRLMIYDGGKSGVYLFLFKSPNEGPSDSDYWYPTLAEAESHATDFGVSHESWQQIPDPSTGMADDRMEYPELD